MYKLVANNTEKTKLISIEKNETKTDIEVCALSLCKITNGKIYIFMDDSIHCFNKDNIVMLPAGYKISRLDQSFDFSADFILFGNALLRQVISKKKINPIYSKCSALSNKENGNIKIEDIEHMSTYLKLFKDMVLNCNYSPVIDGLAFGILYLIISNKSNCFFDFCKGNLKSHWSVYEIIQTNPTFRWKISDVARVLHTSDAILRASLAKEGFTFREILNDTKLEYAYELVNDSQMRIKEIVSLFGYACASQFSAKFKRKYGFSPNDLRLQQSTSRLFVF